MAGERAWRILSLPPRRVREGTAGRERAAMGRRRESRGKSVRGSDKRRVCAPAVFVENPERYPHDFSMQIAATHAGTQAGIRRRVGAGVSGAPFATGGTNGVAGAGMRDGANEDIFIARASPAARSPGGAETR